VPSALILSGGVAHDFPPLSVEVAEVLREAGIDVIVSDDPERALADLDGVDLLVTNMLRWRMEVERYRDQRDRWGISLSEPSRAAILGHVERGGGLLALHASSICFDDWPEWKSLIGGAWVWGRSYHPPFGPIDVTVYPDRHPIVAGLPTAFTTDDEAYGFLDLEDDVIALAVSAHGGALHPLLWARSFGRGRVVHDALGHDAMAYRTPAQREIVRRGARWAIGLPIDRADDVATTAPDASLAYCRRTPDEGRIEAAEAQSSPAG
jgi:hypothetical protein